MPLPTNFNPTEHLQDTIRIWYNREVAKHFSDLSSGDDLTIPRNSLRVACRHEERDSFFMTLARMFLFEITARHGASFHPDIFGIPIDSFESEVVYKPQIKLFFSEPWDDVEEDYGPGKGEITFRLTNESTDSMTMAKASTLATRIHNVFATPPYVWKKGVEKLVYKDPERGYNLSILCRDEAAGKALIENILDIQSHSPDWSFLNIVTPQNATARFPYNPGSKVIMGRSVRKRRLRPRIDVRFRYATLSVHGLPSPINLVDLTGIRKNPVYS